MRSIVKFRQVPICDDEKETEGYEVYIEGRLYCCHQVFFYMVWKGWARGYFLLKTMLL